MLSRQPSLSAVGSPSLDAMTSWPTIPSRQQPHRALRRHPRADFPSRCCIVLTNFNSRFRDGFVKKVWPWRYFKRLDMATDARSLAMLLTDEEAKAAG
jgi:hypothetical protein